MTSVLLLELRFGGSSGPEVESGVAMKLSNRPFKFRHCGFANRKYVNSLPFRGTKERCSHAVIVLATIHFSCSSKDMGKCDARTGIGSACSRESHSFVKFSLNKELISMS
jgi:hypothetical protein